MALVTKVSPSMDTVTAQKAPQLSGLYAGEALAIAAPCYIASADGLVYMTDTTADNEAAEVVGFTPRAVAVGEPVTLFGKGTRFRYGAALTPGDMLYAAATAGRLDTAPTVGDIDGVAFVVNATDIMVARDFRSPHGGKQLHIDLVNGGGAGVDLALAAIATGDQIVSALLIETLANIATISDITATTSIKAGGGNINVVGATDNDVIMLFWYDLT